MIGIRSVTTLKKILRRLLFPFLSILLLVSLSLAVHSQQSAVCPIAAYEGELIQLSPEAFDPDPEIGPAGKLIWEFGHPFDERGQWQTRKGQRGIFDFWVSVSDGELKDTEGACVELFPNNRNPVLSPVPEITITRGDNTRIEATCYDPDGDPVEINYRFNGKDVAFIRYEPPGTYNLEVICTDGFGGIDTERTKLHILMPEPIPVPKPKPIPIPTPVEPEEVEVKLGEPGEIEVVLPAQPTPPPAPKPDVIEVNYPIECPPCPTDEEIDVVIYDSIQQIDTTSADSEQFVVKAEPKPEPAPEPEPVVIGEPVSQCDQDKDRKEEIDLVMGCCS
jgi:hypothetical protein